MRHRSQLPVPGFVESISYQVVAGLERVIILLLCYLWDPAYVPPIFSFKERSKTTKVQLARSHILQTRRVSISSRSSQKCSKIRSATNDKVVMFGVMVMT